MMHQNKKLSPEEYQQRLTEVRRFLLRLIELSEKIQGDLENMDDEVLSLYQQRKDLFTHAEGFLAAWIKHCSLSASDSWTLYRNFLLAVEDEHVKKQYQTLNKSLTFGDENHSLVNNPFLLQQNNEVDDRNLVDEHINKHNLTRSELLEIMSNLTLKELTELMMLAKNLSDGSVWDHKYDL